MALTIEHYSKGGLSITKPHLQITSFNVRILQEGGYVYDTRYTIYLDLDLDSKTVWKKGLGFSKKFTKELSLEDLYSELLEQEEFSGWKKCPDC